METPEVRRNDYEKKKLNFTQQLTMKLGSGKKNLYMRVRISSFFHLFLFE